MGKKGFLLFFFVFYKKFWQSCETHKQIIRARLSVQKEQGWEDSVLAVDNQIPPLQASDTFASFRVQRIRGRGVGLTLPHFS